MTHSFQSPGARQMASCQVYVLTGFLGSGKTTLLQRILALDTDLSNTLVVVNEFGSVGIDGATIRQTVSRDVVELTSGCICCTLKIDLIQTMKDLWERFAPHRVFIEATGVADPEAIISAFDDPLISGQYRVVKTITVVDADFWEAREAFGYVFGSQLACADLILFNKIDILEGQALPALLAEVREAAPDAVIIPSVHCAVDQEVILSLPETREIQPHAVGADALLKAYEPSSDLFRTAPGSMAGAPAADRQGEASGNGYVSFSFEWDAPMDRALFDAFLKELPLNLFRIKGPVRFGEMTAMLNYVGGKAEWHAWPEDRETCLALIGWEVEQEQVLGRLKDCVAH